MFTIAFVPLSGALPQRRTHLGLSSRCHIPKMVAGAGSGAAPAASNDAIREALTRLENSTDSFHRRIAVLGSTGSIGTQTLDLVERAPDKLSVSALSANSDVAQLADQCARFKPRYAAIADASKYDELKAALSQVAPETEALAGSEGVCTVAAASDAETVVTGIVGCAGLLPTVAAIKAGKDIALANKETLIAGGPVMVPLVREYGVGMTAADSEHSAIFQCLQGTPNNALRRIVLTASGGAFRDWKREDLKKVTLADALKHPNWDMGAKSTCLLKLRLPVIFRTDKVECGYCFVHDDFSVTIDSASLYNKAAEVIEAHYLFGVPYDNIEAVIHRQSIIHSMVEFEDSSMLAQLGYPDMRLPLLYSITWPHRVDVELEKFDVLKYPQLTFEPIDFEKYPNMALAYTAGRKAGTMTAVLNAANEAAVEMFRQGKIHFLDIPKLNEAMMEEHAKNDWLAAPQLDDIVEFDRVTRIKAAEYVDSGRLSPVRV